MKSRSLLGITIGLLLLSVGGDVAEATPISYEVSGNAVYDLHTADGPKFGEVSGYMIIDNTATFSQSGAVFFNIIEFDIDLANIYRFGGDGYLTHNILNTDLSLSGTGSWDEIDMSDDIGFSSNTLLDSYRWVEQFVQRPNNLVFFQEITLTQPIPEPSSIFLFAIGTLAIVGFRGKLKTSYV